MIACKLFRRRKDGTIGSLFINRSNVVEVGKWLKSELHCTKGYAYRPGWHVMVHPVAPHLKLTPDRVWMRVEIKDWSEFQRPEC